MASRAVTVKQRSYTNHATITMSDHRPVSAEFELEVRFTLLRGPELLSERIAGTGEHMAPAASCRVILSVWKFRMVLNCLWLRCPQ